MTMPAIPIDPVAEAVRRHCLDSLTVTLGCACGFTVAGTTVDGVAVKALGRHVAERKRAQAGTRFPKEVHRSLGTLFYTHTCTCHREFVGTSVIDSWDQLDAHLDAIAHGQDS